MSGPGGHPERRWRRELAQARDTQVRPKANPSRGRTRPAAETQAKALHSNPLSRNRGLLFALMKLFP